MAILVIRSRVKYAIDIPSFGEYFPIQEGFSYLFSL
nr:hypothetical protein SYMBAF_50474 [Serratia symbiotica]